VRVHSFQVTVVTRFLGPDGVVGENINFKEPFNTPWTCDSAHLSALRLGHDVHTREGLHEDQPRDCEPELASSTIYGTYIVHRLGETAQGKRASES
jgi:hypothetical protein